MDDVRYGSAPAIWEHRNHLTEAQWVPNNLAKGYIRDISREVAGEDVERVTTILTLQRWHARIDANELPLADRFVPTGKFDLNIVPLGVAQAHPEKIP